MSDRDTETERQAVHQLSDAIASGESRVGGYDAYNTGTDSTGKKFGRSGVKRLETMTIDEILASSTRSYLDRDRVFAAGRYQIIPTTLRAAKAALRLPGDAKFTPELQEKIFMDYLIVSKRPAIGKYIRTGSPGLDDAVYAAAMEWASIPCPPGFRTKHGKIADGNHSYYDGTVNKAAARHGAEIRDALANARRAFADGTTSGVILPTTKPIVTEDQRREPKPEAKRTPKPPGAHLIVASVGRGGRNERDDVGAVQAALAAHGCSPGATDHVVGPHTVRAIERFQRRFLRHPDGLVEVGKQTERHLAGSTTSSKPVVAQASTTPEVTRSAPKTAPAPVTTTTDGTYRIAGYQSSRPPGSKPLYQGSVVRAAIPGLPQKSDVKLTPEIVRTANIVARYLPRGTVMTSGWRTDEEQAAIIVRYAGGLKENDLYKTWLVARSKKTVAWVGSSPHRPGLAMDLSGAALGAIDAAVKQCKAEHADAGIDDTILETRNNCLHVNVRP